MEVREVEVKTFVRKLFCSQCNKEMIFLTELLFTSPPQYRYACSKCGTIGTTFEQYPTTIHKEG